MTQRKMVEHELSRQSTVRFMAFLQTERALLPDWHPLHAEYGEQLAELQERVPMGPRRLPEAVA